MRVRPKQMVFYPFPRRHLEPSPSECGRYWGPSHTTQKPSGICPPGTHVRQNEVVCDRRALKYGNTYSRAKKITIIRQNYFWSQVHPTQSVPAKRFRSYAHPTQSLQGKRFRSQVHHTQFFPLNRLRY